MTIPDTSFRNALIQLYPTCFNGSQQMDTTCSGIVNATSLNVNSKSIADLDGVQYFNGLKYLQFDCLCNTSLPTLSNTLRTLDCSNNLLTSITALSDSLQNLDCSNKFTHFAFSNRYFVM